MKRRAFFKSIGLVGASLAAAPVAKVTEVEPDIPVPLVRSRRAFVTTIAGYEPTLVQHRLGSELVAGLAGDAAGRTRTVRIDPVDLNQAKVNLDPPPRVFRWFKRTTPVHKLVLYVPL